MVARNVTVTKASMCHGFVYSKEIIAADRELDEVCRKAERKGCNSPVVVFVPRNGQLISQTAVFQSAHK